MPLGKGYTAEEQLTAAAEHGGVQIVAYPMKAARVRKDAGQAEDALCGRCDVQRVAGGAANGLAPGGQMRQEVYEDPYGFDAWERDARSRCFVHLLNSAQYRTVTGAAPPHVPPTAAEYTAAGLPWFDYYDADRKALEGASRLARLDSVAARKVKEGEPAPDEGASVRPAAGQIKRLDAKRNAVREGAF